MWKGLAGAAVGYGATRREQMQDSFGRVAKRFPRRAHSESGLGKFPLMFILESHDYSVGSLIAGALPYFRYMGAGHVFFEYSSAQTPFEKLHGYVDEMDDNFRKMKELFPEAFYAIQARANIKNPGSCSFTQEGFLKAIKAIGPEGIKDVFHTLHKNEFNEEPEEVAINNLTSITYALSNTSQCELLSKSLSLFGERGVHNVDIEDLKISADSSRDPEAALKRNSVILGNILSIADGGIYYGGVAHHGWAQVGIANILDANYGKVQGVPDPKDVVFIYAKNLPDHLDGPDFRRGGPERYPLYVIDVKGMSPKEFALKCQEAIFENRKHIKELEKGRGGGR